MSTVQSLIISREGLILTLSILPCPQGRISWSSPCRKIDDERLTVLHGYNPAKEGNFGLLIEQQTEQLWVFSRHPRMGRHQCPIEAEQCGFLRTCAAHPTVIEVWAARKLGMVRLAPIIVGGGGAQLVSQQNHKKKSSIWSTKFSIKRGWFTDCQVCETKFLI